MCIYDHCQKDTSKNVFYIPKLVHLQKIEDILVFIIRKQFAVCLYFGITINISWINSSFINWGLLFSLLKFCATHRINVSILFIPFQNIYTNLRYTCYARVRKVCVCVCVYMCALQMYRAILMEDIHVGRKWWDLGMDAFQPAF